jgi:hypothetical protein
LEAKNNLQKMLVKIPLSEDEQAAVDDGHAPLDQLLQRLADIPTPTRAIPRSQFAPRNPKTPPTMITGRGSELGKVVVRDTGIEPVTSTVSTMINNPSHLRKQDFRRWDGFVRNC